jgi:hypothetical protein
MVVSVVGVLGACAFVLVVGSASLCTLVHPVKFPRMVIARTILRPAFKMGSLTFFTSHGLERVAATCDLAHGSPLKVKAGVLLPTVKWLGRDFGSA